MLVPDYASMHRCLRLRECLRKTEAVNLYSLEISCTLLNLIFDAKMLRKPSTFHFRKWITFELLTELVQGFYRKRICLD